LVPALAPVPEQDSQVTETGNLDLRGLALKGFFQRDFHVVAQVSGALAPATAASTLPGHAEQISKISRMTRRSRRRIRAAAAHACSNAACHTS